MKLANHAAMLLALSCVAGTAAADTTNFEGMSIYVGGSAISSAVKMEGNGANVEGLGKSAFGADIGGDYGLKLTDNTVVLLGGSYGLGSLTAVEISGTGTDFDGTSKFKNRWSLYAAPGITFGKDVLLYGKLSYGSAKASGDDGKTHTGMGYGAGARFALTSQVFLNLEFMVSQFGKETYGPVGSTNEVSATATSGTVALGYKF